MYKLEGTELSLALTVPDEVQLFIYALREGRWYYDTRGRTDSVSVSE